MAIISELPGAISDNRQRIKAVNHWENHIATLQPFLSLNASNEKFCNFLIFCWIFMIFLPKCRASYIVSEKGHGAGENGHGSREKGHGAAPC